MKNKFVITVISGCLFIGIYVMSQVIYKFLFWILKLIFEIEETVWVTRVILTLAAITTVYAWFMFEKHLTTINKKDGLEN